MSPRAAHLGPTLLLSTGVRRRVLLGTSSSWATWFRDVKDGGGYRRRPSSASGETVERSERGHPDKGECEREVSRLKADRYPNARVLDATGRRMTRTLNRELSPV